MAVRLTKQAEPIPGYTLVERLGRGGFGEVWKAEAPGGLPKAIKFVFGDMNSVRDSRQGAEQELRALNRVKTIRHPFILSLERVDIIDGQLIIVMELADSSLMDRLRECHSLGLPGIPREELLRYMDEAAEALDLMNIEHQLQHLDIKPQNLFLVHNHIKVADFGLVKDLEGMRATVTGGVTPIYAAPETFNGWVSRYCDQYSLAIVYQELLTGQRPFDGTNPGQLVMQHTSKEPDLSSLPTADREVIRRALAKTPGERFPSCTYMVRALRSGGHHAASDGNSAAPPLPRSAPTEDGRQAQTVEARPTFLPRIPSPSSQEFVLPAETGSDARVTRGAGTVTPRPAPAEAGTKSSQLMPGSVAAPVEFKGGGILFPALVIGLGQTGSLVLQRLREGLCERFGSLDPLSNLQLLYLDTDAESISAAVRCGGTAALAGPEVLHARLNRPVHFHKAREGLDLSWLDMQMLYRMPRNQTTAGLRCLGRLALIDNYLEISQRLQTMLAEVTEADSLAAADRQTRLGLRVNRPRVYVVSSLAGGTGSGMFLDVAFIARAILRDLGYQHPDLVGLFFLPPAEGSGVKYAMAASNAYAALTELHHYSSVGVCFESRYLPKQPPLVDDDPPFGRCIFLGGDDQEKNQRELAAMAGGYLARDLVTPLGRTADEQRDKAKSSTRPPLLETIATFRLSWPRRALVEHAGRKLSHRLVENWLVKENPAFKEPIRQWAREQWSKRGFEAERLIETLRTGMEKKLEGDPGEMCAEFHEQFVRHLPSNQYPDPDWLRKSLDQLEAIVGKPEAAGPPPAPTPLVEALEHVNEKLFSSYEQKLAQLAVFFVEQPGYRFAGAEESIRAFHDLLQETASTQETLCQEMTARANHAYNRILEAIKAIKAVPAAQRKKTHIDNSGLGEYFRQFPSFRIKSLILQRVLSVYRSLLGNCPEFLRELQYCRARLADLEKALSKPLETKAVDVNHGPGRPLFASGCTNLREAVDHFLHTITPEEVQDIDQRVQAIIKQQFTALVHICTTPTNLLPNLQEEIRKELESYVATRLGGAGVVETFLDQFHLDQAAREEISSAHGEAMPKLALERPRQLEECSVVLVPEELAAKRFMELAQDELPQAEVVLGPRADDITFFREIFGWTWQQLAQLGPQAQEAYRERLAAQHFSPHARMDAGPWQGPRQ
jgi:serine/threonine protein kinase